MAKSKYAKYVITKPKLVTELAFHDFKISDISGFTFPDEVYLDSYILKGAKGIGFT